MKTLISDMLNDGLHNNFRGKWEFFKFKVRCVSVKKNLKNSQEADLLLKFNCLLKKNNLTSEEELQLKDIQIQLDQIHLDIAKGAFIRSEAQWLRTEKGILVYNAI